MITPLAFMVLSVLSPISIPHMLTNLKLRSISILMSPHTKATKNNEISTFFIPSIMDALSKTLAVASCLLRMILTTIKNTRDTAIATKIRNIFSI